MITTVAGLGVHIIMSSFQLVRSVGQVLGYVIPRTMSTFKVNFNSKHLTKGDPLPPFNGKPRIYNMRFCPYAQRAVLAIAAKNIDYEIVNIDLIDKPEWLTSKSAFAKVPALEIEDGVSIYESLIVAEYLDEAYPQRPLLPKDPVRKAFDKIIIEAASPIQGVQFKLIRFPETINEDVLAGFFKALDFVQNQLQERGTTFLAGDEPGYVDYMIWPWFERLDAFADERIKIDAQKYKRLTEYISKMWIDPVVKEYAVSKEIYQDFFAAYSAGRKPNYDVLLEE